MYLLWLTTRNRATKPEELGPFAWSAVLVPRTVPPPPPFDSLIDTVMLVPPIMVVHFNETSILEYDPPANVQETPRRRTRGKNKLIGGKLARKFSSSPRVNFISFEYLIFLGLSNIVNNLNIGWIKFMNKRMRRENNAGKVHKRKFSIRYKTDNSDFLFFGF